jgi:radical SAM protein with 4Fe4S-binding SPASM domain
MMVRLKGKPTICPQSRDCDSGIRTIQPDGDYYSCGSFGDDKDKSIDFEYEMAGGFSTPLSDDIELVSMKNACFSCPMFEICNGCRKTIKDTKKFGMVEEHCRLMKQLAPEIIKANGVHMETTPYIDESCLQ